MEIVTLVVVIAIVLGLLFVAGFKGRRTRRRKFRVGVEYESADSDTVETKGKGQP